ncbi:MAG: hypothetical protein ACK2UK_03760 [Candidatus Promineifilaceae bacterium]
MYLTVITLAMQDGLASESSGLPWKWVLLIVGTIFIVLWFSKLREKRRQRGLEREFSEALGFDPKDGSGGAVGGVAAIEDVLHGVNSLLSAVSDELTDAGIPDVRPQPLAEVFKNLSPEMRRKLAIPLGIEAQGELTSLAKLHMELVRNVATINYRLVAKRERAAIEHVELTMHAEMLPKNIEVLMDGVLETQHVLKQQKYAQLEGEMKALGQIFLSETAKSTLSKIQRTQGLPDIAAEQKVEEIIQVIVPPDRSLPRTPDLPEGEQEGHWEELVLRRNGGGRSSVSESSY